MWKLISGLLPSASGLVSAIMPSNWAVYALAAALCFGGGFYTAWHYKTLTEEAAVTETSHAVVQETHQQDVVTQQVSEKAEEKQVEIRTVIQTIVKRIPVYVDRKADSRCIVPRGFVRVHDAAANGVSVVPPAPGQSDDAPSGIGLSAVAGTVAENYGTCQSIRQQLIDLQGWIRQQQAVSAENGH